MAAAVAWGHCAARCLTNGCPKAPEARRQFGCDGDGSGYMLTCWACFPDHGMNCPLCEGAGRVVVTDCPRRIVTREVADMHHAYQAWRGGFMPVGGGWLDQAHTYVQSMRLLDNLYGMHERIEMEKRRG